MYYSKADDLDLLKAMFNAKVANHQINPLIAVKNGYIKLVEASKVQQVGIDVTIKIDKPVTIPNLTHFNFEINELVDIPEDVYADITIRSSLSRNGVFQSSGKYDPGFHGVAGLTIYNLSGKDIKIEPNDRVAQIVFFNADAASAYNGHYNASGSIESQYNKRS